MAYAPECGSHREELIDDIVVRPDEYILPNLAHRRLQRIVIPAPCPIHCHHDISVPRASGPICADTSIVVRIDSIAREQEVSIRTSPEIDDIDVILIICAVQALALSTSYDGAKESTYHSSHPSASSASLSSKPDELLLALPAPPVFFSTQLPTSTAVYSPPE